MTIVGGLEGLRWVPPFSGHSRSPAFSLRPKRPLSGVKPPAARVSVARVLVAVVGRDPFDRTRLIVGHVQRWLPPKRRRIRRSREEDRGRAGRDGQRRSGPTLRRARRVDREGLADEGLFSLPRTCHEGSRKCRESNLIQSFRVWLRRTGSSFTPSSASWTQRARSLRGRVRADRTASSFLTYVRCKIPRSAATGGGT